LRNSSRLILTLVVLLVSGNRSYGSGGPYCDDYYCHSFFAPEIIHSPLDAPFFLSAYTFYGHAWRLPNGQDPLGDVQTANLGEWSRYFHDAIPQAELSLLLYSMPEAEVNDLAASLSRRNVALSERTARLRTILLRDGRRWRVIASLEYLALAKRVEPLATRRARGVWQDESSLPPVDQAKVQALIRAAESRLRRSDTFIAQRYRLQVMRLLFYSGQYGAAQRYFERHRGAFSQENSPKYRVLDLAAGAYYKDKKYGRANYLFSIVFDKFPPLRRSAYASFHPMEDPDWRETLALAKTGRQREILWQLLGIYADGMAAIDQIYRANPRSSLLPLLLVREVNKAENDWSSNQDLDSDRFAGQRPRRPDVEVVGRRRLATIRSIADAGRTSQPYLWKLAAGHLLALADDSRTAEAYLDTAAATAPTAQDIQAQIRMTRLFSRVRAVRTIDRGAEPYWAQEYTWLQQNTGIGGERATHADAWTRQRLSEVYAEGGDTVRALMLTDTPASAVYRSVGGVDTILGFLRSATTPFDRWLVKNYPYSAERFEELRGLLFLYAGDFPNALDAFRRAGNDVRQDLNADPFTIHIKDCHECDFDAPHTKYSKLSFAERMESLSRAAQGQGEAAAAASFELANGFYNMSYYGNGRDIYDTAQGNLRDSALSVNMDAAERYYLQAGTLSSNRELKAQAIFMAAKAEQGRYYSTGKRDADPHRHEYFRTLKTSYADTQYYQEIIRECGYFRIYLAP
jgi:hypothetical protein